MLTLLAAGMACTFLTPTPVAWSITATPEPTTIPLAPTSSPVPASPILSPTAVPTPLPSASPTAGPWLVYTLGDAARLIARDAASGAPLSAALGAPILWPADLRTGASPAGGWVAVRTGKRDLTDPGLDLVKLPDTTVQLHIPLLSDTLAKSLPEAAGGLPAPVSAAAQPDALSWSPDGRSLAFVGASQGPSSDLYLFDTQTREVRRLTDGLNQVASPTWSPDGMWVVFQEVVSFSASPGWKLGAVWEAAVDHNELRKLYTPPSNSTGEIFLGWVAPDALLSCTRAPDGVREVRSVPVSARFVNRIFDGPLDLLAYDPAAQTLAFSETPQTGAPVGLVGGLYLLPAAGGQPQYVHAGSWKKLAFSTPLGRFIAAGDQGLLLFAPGKDAILVQGEENGLASPDGHWLVGWGENAHPGVRLYQPDGSLLQEVASGPVSGLLWQPDSKAFYYLSGGQLFRAAFPDARPAALDQGLLPGSLGWLAAPKK